MTRPDSATAHPPPFAPAAARVDDVPVPAHAAEHAAACRNCEAPMHGAYCASCGQRAVDADPTARELAHDAAQELLNVDGKILSTLRLLFTRPGFLTVEHLRGRRVRYVAPIRLYLTCSVLYFLVAAIVDPVEKAVAENRDRNVRVTRTPAAFEDAQRVSQDSVASLLEAQGKERGGVSRTFFGQAARVQRDRLGFARQMRETIPKIFFVFVPLFAWIVSVVYRRRAHYPAHLFFALHTFAFGFAAAAVAEVVGLARGMSFVAGWALMAVWAWYGVRALRAVYGGTLAATIARASAITALGLVGFGVVGMVGIAVVFLAF